MDVIGRQLKLGPTICWQRVLPQNPPFVGVVGPACTVAAMSAAIVLADEDYPLISFAVTGSHFQTGIPSPLFSAQYGAGAQAEAVAASVSARSLPHCILIIHSEHLPKVLFRGVCALEDSECQ